MNTKVCSCCGSVGTPKKKAQGSLLMEFCLWMIFILPGFLYSLWRMTSKRSVCRTCESEALLPPNSPAGQKILKELRASQ